MRPNPLTARVAAAMVALEGLLLVALGGLLVVRGFGEDTHNRAGAEIGGVFAILGGILLIGLARFVLAGRRWARSPSIVAQILALPVGIGLLQGHKVAYGLPLVVVAALALVTLIVASAAGGVGEDG